MNSREEMRVRLIQIFSHLKELKAKLDRWEQGTEEDFVIDKGDANDDSVVEITENVSISYDTVGNPMSSNEKTPKQESSSRNSCFNCGGSHMISECKEPKDHARIAANRRQFGGGGGGGPQARYHVDEKQKLAHVRPGLPSKRLRKALGVKDKRLPEFIYRMRDLGYPPAWLRHAAVNHSGLSMYIDRERVVTAEETTNGEDGELENDFKNVQYDAEKLVEWPGFNVDMPKGFTDESRYYRAPGMKENQSLTYMKGHMSVYEHKGYIRGQMADTNVEKGDDEVEVHQSPFAAVTAHGSAGTVKSRDEGTPIVSSYSPFTSLPDSSKWTTMTTDHIFFENLPDSTGKYEQFKEVLKKCRRRLRQDPDDQDQTDRDSSDNKTVCSNEAPPNASDVTDKK